MQVCSVAINISTFLDVSLSSLFSRDLNLHSVSQA